MFSRTVEYALRAMVYLASQGQGPQSTSAIARATQVPPAYLAKVLQSLGRSGLVVSQRGLRGGVALARSPAELRILEVVNAVEPLRRIRTCPLGLAGHGSRLCPLHGRMDAAVAQVESALQATSLAEILAEPTASVPLCNFPAPPDSLPPTACAGRPGRKRK